MRSISEWKKKIIRLFLHKRFPNAFRARRLEDIAQYFGDDVDSNFEIAFLELLEDKIIERYGNDEKQHFVLNTMEQMVEIQRILRGDPIEERAPVIQPTKEETKGLRYIFHTTSKWGYNNRGVYYHYVREDLENESWVSLIKTRPNVKPYRINLYSLNESNSKITQIWEACKTIYVENNYKPFYRKQVENIAQEACDNRRLGSKAAFDIFVHKGMLKISHKTGRSVFYEIPTLIPKNKEHEHN